jgi:hypothetical protein
LAPLFGRKAVKFGLKFRNAHGYTLSPTGIRDKPLMHYLAVDISRVILKIEHLLCLTKL